MKLRLCFLHSRTFFVQKLLNYISNVALCLTFSVVASIIFYVRTKLFFV